VASLADLEVPVLHEGVLPVERERDSLKSPFLPPTSFMGATPCGYVYISTKLAKLLHDKKIFLSGPYPPLVVLK
jgi:hypothetical protein